MSYAFYGWETADPHGMVQGNMRSENAKTVDPR